MNNYEFKTALRNAKSEDERLNIIRKHNNASYYGAMGYTKACPPSGKLEAKFEYLRKQYRKNPENLPENLIEVITCTTEEMQRDIFDYGHSPWDIDETEVIIHTNKGRKKMDLNTFLKWCITVPEDKYFLVTGSNRDRVQKRMYYVYDKNKQYICRNRIANEYEPEEKEEYEKSYEDEISKLLTSNKPYMNELRGLSNITEFLKNFLISSGYDYHQYTKTPHDYSYRFSDHQGNRVVGEKQTSTYTETVLDMMREYMSIRFLQDNDEKPFERAYIKCTEYFFSTETDAERFCQLNPHIPTIIEVNDYGWNTNYKVVVRNDEFDNRTYTQREWKQIYGDNPDA